MGVDFMDPVISRNAWFCTLSNVYIADLDADDSVVGRIVPIYIHSSTLFLQHQFQGMLHCLCVPALCHPTLFSWVLVWLIR